MASPRGKIWAETWKKLWKPLSWWNTYQQQHKGSSRDSLGWGHEGMRKGQTHIHRHTEKLRLGDRSHSRSEAQGVHYKQLNKKVSLSHTKEAGLTNLLVFVGEHSSGHNHECYSGHFLPLLSTSTYEPEEGSASLWALPPEVRGSAIFPQVWGYLVYAYVKKYTNAQGYLHSLLRRRLHGIEQVR